MTCGSDGATATRLGFGRSIPLTIWLHVDPPSVDRMRKFREIVNAVLSVLYAGDARTWVMSSWGVWADAMSGRATRVSAPTRPIMPMRNTYEHAGRDPPVLVHLPSPPVQVARDCVRSRLKSIGPSTNADQYVLVVPEALDNANRSDGRVGGERTAQASVRPGDEQSEPRA